MTRAEREALVAARMVSPEEIYRLTTRKDIAVPSRYDKTTKDVIGKRFTRFFTGLSPNLKQVDKRAN